MGRLLGVTADIISCLTSYRTLTKIVLLSVADYTSSVSPISLGSRVIFLAACASYSHLPAGSKVLLSVRLVRLSAF